MSLDRKSSASIIHGLFMFDVNIPNLINSNETPRVIAVIREREL